jgi:hypothetical protein
MRFLERIIERTGVPMVYVAVTPNKPVDLTQRAEVSPTPGGIGLGHQTATESYGVSWTIGIVRFTFAASHR